MKFASLALIGIVFSNPASAEPVDCEAVRRNFDKFLDDTADTAEAPSLLECIPYSDPVPISGTWASGWEINQFYEGQSPSWDDAWQFQRDWTYLSVDGTPLEDVGGVESGALLRLEFIGRRPLCSILDDYRVVFLERVISQEVVEEPKK